MLRIVVVAFIVVVVWALLVKLVRDAKNSNVDWTGIAVIVGFIVLAFWLRHVTGLG